MDGGIGEAALMGALVGGGASLLTGKNPLTGALLGGVTGGAMSGISGALAGTGTNTAVQNQILAGAAENGVSSSVLGAGLNPGLAYTSAGSLSPGMEAALSSGVGNVGASQIANAGLTGLGGMQNVGLTQGAGMAAEQAVQNAAQNSLVNQGIAANVMPVRDLANSASYLGGEAVRTAAPTVADAAAKEAVKAGASKGILGGVKDWYATAPWYEKAGAGIAGSVALNKLFEQPDMLDPNLGKQKIEHPLAGLSEDFRGSTVTPDVYRQNYSGYVRGPGFAEGGIAAMANGGMGNNINFPQGRLDSTQYATPTQLPASASVINADYEQATDPYSGSPIKMADGGIARFAGGGLPDMGSSFSWGNIQPYTKSSEEERAEMAANAAAGKFQGGMDGGGMKGMGMGMAQPQTQSAMQPATPTSEIGFASGFNADAFRNSVMQQAQQQNMQQAPSTTQSPFQPANTTSALPTTNESTWARGANGYSAAGSGSGGGGSGGQPVELKGPVGIVQMAEGGAAEADKYTPTYSAASTTATPTNYSLGDSFSLLQAANPGIASSYLYGNGISAAPGLNAMISQPYNRITGQPISPEALQQQYASPAPNPQSFASYTNQAPLISQAPTRPYIVPQAAPAAPTTPAAPANPAIPGTMQNSPGQPMKFYGSGWGEPDAKAPMYSAPWWLANGAINVPEDSQDYKDWFAAKSAQKAAEAAGLVPPAAAGGLMNSYASGGIAGYNLGGYASGGNPRLLKGPGDGMSDNIPATIGGRQPARLADGEFVVPADVVSHLGNGSTDAGAKHLYAMMDNVRKARTGNKKQGKQIKPQKFLPA